MHLSFLLIIMGCQVSVAAANIYIRENRLNNVMCNVNNVISTSIVRSAIECQTLCDIEDNCVSTFFTPSTGNCTNCGAIYKSSAGLEKLQGTVYFRVKDPKTQHPAQNQSQSSILTPPTSPTLPPQPTSTSTQSTGHAQTCPTTWRHFRGSCYFFNHHGLGWHEAQRQCESMGGHLVDIGTWSEMEFLKSVCQSQHRDRDEHVWIGASAHDPSGPSSYTWTDGVRVTSGFNMLPHAGRLHECVYIDVTRDSEWMTSHCGEHFASICEKMAA